MTLLEFIRDEAPKKCRVHPSFGRVAELVFFAEITGDPAFTADKFETTGERAELAAPYPSELTAERAAVVRVAELAICNHRQKRHGEDHAERIALLKASIMSEEEIEMAVRDWWNE